MSWLRLPLRKAELGKGHNLCFAGSMGNLEQGEVVMKQDTQKRQGVSNASAAKPPIGDPRPSTASSQDRRVSAAATELPGVAISNKYIDSRLKQFCLR